MKSKYQPVSHYSNLNNW